MRLGKPLVLGMIAVALTTLLLRTPSFYHWSNQLLAELPNACAAAVGGLFIVTKTVDSLLCFFE